MTQATLLLHLHSTLTALASRPANGDWEYLLVQDRHLV